MDTERSAPQDLRVRLFSIEHDLDEGRYRPGPWSAFLAATRNRSEAERAAIAEDVSRVSRKLHLRSQPRTVSLRTGLAVELVATFVGGLLLFLAVVNRSALAAIGGALVWVVTFEPLVKLAVGSLLGVGYEYAYLHNGEPRFKMRYGSYLAAPRWARVTLHLAGMIGSPIGAYAAGTIAEGSLPGAAVIAYVLCWTLVALNVGLLAAGLLGLRRVGSLSLRISSGGSAGAEIREWIG